MLENLHYCFLMIKSKRFKTITMTKRYARGFNVLHCIPASHLPEQWPFWCRASLRERRFLASVFSFSTAQGCAISISAT